MLCYDHQKSAAFIFVIFFSEVFSLNLWPNLRKFFSPLLLRIIFSLCFVFLTESKKQQNVPSHNDVLFSAISNTPISIAVYGLHHDIEKTNPAPKESKKNPMDQKNTTMDHGNFSRIFLGLIHMKIPKPWIFYGFHDPKDTLQNDPKLFWKDNSFHVKDFQIFWPMAQVHTKEGEVFRGYEEELLLPFILSVSSETSWTLNLTMEAMVCGKVCIPLQWSYVFNNAQWMKLPQKNLQDIKNTKIAHGMTHMENLEKFLQDKHHGGKTQKNSEKKSPGLYFLMAFFGGLILNIMPCVLPVLVLKIKTFTKGGSLRTLSAFTFGGIMTGFLGLGIFFLSIKEIFGLLMGWGAHMNHPWVGLLMVGALLLSAYSLFGIFHWSTPQWVYTALPRTSTTGGLSSFFSGILAVFLATPCSAPFLGPALGFAFGQQGILFLLFFLVVGFGFGFPYFLGLFLPRSLVLPKPGPWMIMVEYFMAFLFLLSALWFFSTSFYPLVDEVFYPLCWSLFLFLFILPFGLRGFFFLWPKGKNYSVFLLGLFMGGPLTLLGILPFYNNSGKTLGISMKDGEISWVPFQEKTLKEALSQNKIVVIDITGHGCLLCRINKKIFLDPAVQKRLTQKNVVCLRGDYLKDQQILLPFLQRYGRAAIPFNMIIGPRQKEGLVLSERLSLQEVLWALNAS